MTICVVEVDDHVRLGEWLAARNELEPDEPLRMEQLTARRAAEPRRRELLATVGAEIVGVGSVGPKEAPPDLAYGYLAVTETWKQCGVESVLLDEIRRVARLLGRSRLELWVGERDAGFIAQLKRQGFSEVMREAGLALNVAEAPELCEVHLPDCITVQPIARRPDLADGAYELAAQTWPEIPGETGIQEREPWLSLHVEAAAGGAVVAVHGGEVVGFAGLHRLADEGLYEHGLLAVRTDCRRRGIARAMKIAQLQWLQRHHARRVVTWNAETNEPARRLNLSLGYTCLPSSIAFHGRA